MTETLVRVGGGVPQCVGEVVGPTAARASRTAPTRRQPGVDGDGQEGRTPHRVGLIVARSALFDRLDAAPRVTQVSGPAGSGKTVLVRSWLAARDGADNAAWVTIGRHEPDATQFWVSIVEALRRTTAGSTAIGALSPAPDLDVSAVAERVLSDLTALQVPLWLVLDDVQDLRSPTVLRQLETLIVGAPKELRIILITRIELRVGLHRLRLEGELAEIRGRDLRFSEDEARTLFDAAGAVLSDHALRHLVDRTEGWAAGLRLAALCMAGGPGDEGFALEFSGSERTVADYLLAEVLDRQSPEVRRMLLRTSVLERVSGDLADTLTGGDTGQRTLQGLEDANAFTVALDAERSWFRYHHLFAELLQLELRRTEPSALPELHRIAAERLAAGGYPIEAVRQAQAAGDWPLATRLLSDAWLGLWLDGHGRSAHQLLARFPSLGPGDAELAALVAADELDRGSVELAEHHITRAMSEAESVSPDRRPRFDAVVGAVRLLLARRRGDIEAVEAETTQLLATAERLGAAKLDLGADLRAFVLTSFGGPALESSRREESERHLDEGINLARRIGRPYLELSGLTHAASIALFHSFDIARQHASQAVALAELHGWDAEPIVGVACFTLGAALLAQGRLQEAEQWLERSERVIGQGLEPSDPVRLQYTRGLLDLAYGRLERAYEEFSTVERLAGLLPTRQLGLLARERSVRAQALIRLGEMRHAEELLAEFEGDSNSTCIAVARAALQIARADPAGATDVLVSAISEDQPFWTIQALLLEAIARDALGDAAGAGNALDGALALAEPERVLLPFLLHPAASQLLEQHRGRTCHAAMVGDVLAQLGPEPGAANATLRAPVAPVEQITEAETRVLRYLPTNLTACEIANEVYLSVHTVRTHIRNVYRKLGSNRRSEAVERARSLGLLSPSGLTWRSQGATLLK